MKKMKRFFALFLAMAMVLGMSMTTFAAENDSTTITVNGLTPKTYDEGKAPVDAEGNPISLTATVQYAQVIIADRTTTTGWNFVSNAIRDAYIDAFGETETDKDKAGQNVLKTMTQIKTNAEGVAVSDKVSKALEKVNALEGIFNDTNKVSASEAGVAQWSVSEAGVYAIRPSQEGFIYSNMAAYVGFGPVTNGVEGIGYPDLQPAELTAKRVETSFTKENSDTDKVVAIGDEVTFTIKTNVPFVSPLADDSTYIITDTITGAEYVKTGYTIKMSGEDIAGAAIQWGEGDKANTFTIDLSSLVNGGTNEHVGEPIEVEYKAKITDVTIDNKAKAGNRSDDDVYATEVTDNLYTGIITLVKYGTDDTSENPLTLAGAGFEVYKVDAQGNPTGEALKFRVVESSEASSDDVDDMAISPVEKYIYDPNGEETENVVFTTVVFTQANGQLVVEGLDKGKYAFKEVVAPEGYSINERPSVAELTLGEANKATTNLKANTDMTDTTLSALPSTGGIGTTIFTVGGCAIMILAAGMFFVSRRRASR